MSAVLASSVETVPARIKTATERLAHLKPYQFKPGHAPCGGRPKGSRDSATIYLESLPLKARQWVKSTAPAVLIDARKIALPIDSDQQSSTVQLTRIEILAELQRRGIAVPATLTATEENVRPAATCSPTT